MSDLSVAVAEDLAAWLTQGADFDPAPGTVYVTLFDDTGTELDGEFPEARVDTAAGEDWTQSGSYIENDTPISFGVPDADVTGIEDIALYDSASGSTELTRTTLDAAPVDVPAGEIYTFASGQISIDIVDVTE